jgi:hypothetical protein
MEKKRLILAIALLPLSVFGQATLATFPNGSDVSPFSPLHLLAGATKRIYANQCTGAQSLGCATSAPTITWTASCGSVSPSSGPYVDFTAPSSGSTCIITATDAADSLTATVTATIETPAVSVNIVPHALTLYKGQHALLTAFVLGSVNRNVNWSGTGGTLLSQGWTADFSATSAGTYAVTATSVADATKSYTSTFFVTNNAMPATATGNHTEPVDPTPTGSGTTYDVGPSQTYTTINSVPWPTMPAGSTVRIHNEGNCANPTTYAERWLVTQSGTATQPIRIVGVPSSDNCLPVITATNSTTLPTYSYHTTDGLGAIILYNGVYSDTPAYVQYIEIEGLRVVNFQSNPDNTWTRQDGTSTTFGTTQPGNVCGETGATTCRGTTSIRLQAATNITVRGNDLENNDNGMFVQSQIPESLMSRWFLLQGNYFAGNGTIGQTHDHSTYAQAFGQVVQGNYYNDKVSGDQGSQLKTRCEACVTRYNYFQGVTNASLGRLLDMVAPEASNAEGMVQEYFKSKSTFTGVTTLQSVTAMEDWYQQYAYGNIFNNGVTVYPVHYSEDVCPEDVAGRPGYFYYNTFYGQGPPAANYKWTLIDGGYAGGAASCYPTTLPRTRWPSVYVADNAITVPAASTSVAPYFFISDLYETPIYLYTNWISSAWGSGGTAGIYGHGTAYTTTSSGVTYMTGNTAQQIYLGNTSTTCGNSTCGGELITGTGIPFSTTTYAPTAGGPLVGAATALPANLASSFPVTFQYNPATYLLTPRANTADLGALAASSTPQYTLTTATVGAGTGTVSGCGGNYLSGAAYVCTATPNGGSVFAGWSSTCGGTASGATYGGNMPSSNCSVTATFTALVTGPGSTWKGVTLQGIGIH